MNHWNTLPEETGANRLVLHHEWGCFCQAGDNGIVFSPKGNYRTAFFEAFPDNPNTFIRGEGTDIVAAEEDAWRQLQKIHDCKNHDFERKSYRNGGAICKHCGLFAMVFDPLEFCLECGIPTYYTCDKNNNWYCEEHARNILPSEYSDVQWGFVYTENEDWDWKHGKFNPESKEA